MRDCAIDWDRRCTQIHFTGTSMLVEVPERALDSWSKKEEEGSRKICLHHGGTVLAREYLVTRFCGMAPMGVRLQKTRPTHPRDMHYTERDGVFAHRLDTVGVAIWQALPHIRRQFMPKRSGIALKKEIEEHFVSGTPSDLETATCGLSGLRASET
jgi:hypothetical protein